MPSVAIAPAAPQLRGAAQRRRFADCERPEVEVELFGGRQCCYATALYCVEWERHYGPDPDDLRGYLCPSVTLCDLLADSGASLLNAAGRRQCAAIARWLEEHEADAGPPEPHYSPFHYD